MIDNNKNNNNNNTDEDDDVNQRSGVEFWASWWNVAHKPSYSLLNNNNTQWWQSTQPQYLSQSIPAQILLHYHLFSLIFAQVKVLEYLLLKILKYWKTHFLFNINALLCCFHDAFTEPRNSLNPPNECTDLLGNGHGCSGSESPCLAAVAVTTARLVVCALLTKWTDAFFFWKRQYSCSRSISSIGVVEVSAVLV